MPANDGVVARGDVVDHEPAIGLRGGEIGVVEHQDDGAPGREQQGEAAPQRNRGEAPPGQVASPAGAGAGSAPDGTGSARRR